MKIVLFAQIINLICVKKRVLKKNSYCKNPQEEHIKGTGYIRISVVLITFCFRKGTAVAQWLRCCATNWKVAGSNVVLFRTQPNRELTLRDFIAFMQANKYKL